MPERIGGGPNINPNVYAGNTQPMGGTTDVNVGGAATTSPTGHTNHSFEVNTNSGNGGVFQPFVDESLYHDLGNASNRSKTGVEIGTYNQPGSFQYNGWLTGENSNATADWKNRTEWKGNNALNATGLGVSTGPMVKEKQESAQRLGGMWIRDDKAGVQAKVSGAVEGNYGSAQGSARLFSEVGAKQLAGFGISNKGLTAMAQAEARVVAAGAEVSGQVSSRSVQLGGQNINLNANVYGRATVEASANVGGEVTFNRNPPTAVLEGKAGAFAGAKAYGRAGFGIGDLIKVGVYGEGWAGAGAEASGVVGYRDGKFSLGGSAGIGLGLGGKVGVRVDVDVVKAAQMAKDVADVDRNGKLTLNDGATAVTKTADLAMTGVEKGVDRTLHAIDADKDGRFSTRDLGLHAGRLKQSLEKALDVNGDGKLGLRDVGVAGQRLGQGIAEGAESLGRGAVRVGETVADGALAVGRAVHNLADLNNDGKLGLADAGIAARSVGQGMATGAEAVGRGVVAGAEALGRGAVQVGGAVVDGVRTVGRAAHNLADVNNDGKIGLADAGAAARNVGRAVGQGVQVAGQTVANGVRAVGRAAHNLADANNDGKIGLADVGAAARNVGNAARNGVQAVGQGISTGARAVGRVAHNLADANNDGKIGLADVGAAARNVGSAVSNGAQAVGQGISTGARAVASGAKAVASGAASVGRAVASQVGEAASTLADGASRTYKRAQNVVGRVANFFGW